MAPPLIAAAIYARQSVTHEGSESLANQVEACTEAASRLGVEVVCELVEAPSTSGYKNRGRDRAKFNELLELFARREIRAVLVYKSERLSRGGWPGWAPVFDVLDKAGVEIDHAVATPSGWMSEFEIDIRATMDREESKKLSSRITDLHARTARAGKPRGGGLRPDGYARDLVTVVEAEAELIREAAARILQGESCWGIVVDWEKRGIKSAAGHVFGPQTLKHCLKSGRIAGQLSDMQIGAALAKVFVDQGLANECGHSAIFLDHPGDDTSSGFTVGKLIWIPQASRLPTTSTTSRPIPGSVRSTQVLYEFTY